MTKRRLSEFFGRFSRVAYFLGAVLLHLILFLMLAEFVVWKAPPPPPPDGFGTAQVNLAPPPAPPPPPLTTTTAPSITPTLAAPVVVVANPISVNASSSFNLPTGKVSDTLDRLQPAGGGAAGTAGQPATGSAFGSATAHGNQLEGYLYDLKQTADGKPTGMNPALYHQILIKFVAASWDPSVLAPYYKSPTPVYTSQILIPDLDADAGPSAFGLQKEVKPMMWIVWYKGSVSAPASATFQFAGFADDILLVRINGTDVLDGSINPVDLKLKDTMPWPASWMPSPPLPHYGDLRVGPSTAFTGGLANDIDIIIGEEPGGHFNASLFVLDTDTTYPTDKDGQPILPLFQLGQGPLTFKGIHPPISPTPAPWSGESK